MSAHSTKDRSTDSMLRELIDRTTRLETRLCVLMDFFNVKFNGRELVDPKTAEKTK